MTVAEGQPTQLTKTQKGGEVHAERGQQSDDEFNEAWQVFQYWTGTRDAAHFRGAYVGRYTDRAEFGRNLVTLLGASEHLARLPDWLQDYLRVDGEAAAHDFEAAGHYFIYDAPEGGGCYVFSTNR